MAVGDDGMDMEGKERKQETARRSEAARTDWPTFDSERAAIELWRPRIALEKAAPASQPQG